MQAKIRNIVRRLGQEQIDQLLADYERGRTTIDLMAVYGHGKTSVIHLLGANGVALRRQGLTNDQTTEATRLYDDGRSPAYIARTLAVPQETVRRALHAAGVNMLQCGGSTVRLHLERQ